MSSVGWLRRPCLLLLQCRGGVVPGAGAGLRSLRTTPVVCERLRRSVVPLRASKSAKTTQVARPFVDWVTTTVQGGDGGDGAIECTSVFAVEFAGPDGGNGGNGGHVVFRASANVNSLERVKRKITAQFGQSGSGRDCHGKNSPHTYVDVPVGTVLRNLQGQTVAELLHEGALFVAAKGGAGGKGNAHFKTSVNKTPMLAEEGGKGERFMFHVELLSMAHVGFIGFPNAGKSTLLRAISRARPKVAPYPFTTMSPHIGMVEFDDYEQLAVADIPGIVPDAHKDKGLGISFLRHIERCNCLIYVVDLSQPDPVGQFETLQFELEQYRPGLSRRPHAVVANKIDLERALENRDVFAEFASAQKLPVFYSSGKMGVNLKSVLMFMRETYDRHKMEKERERKEKEREEEERERSFFRFEEVEEENDDGKHDDSGTK